MGLVLLRTIERCRRTGQLESDVCSITRPLVTTALVHVAINGFHSSPRLTTKRKRQSGPSIAAGNDVTRDQSVRSLAERNYSYKAECGFCYTIGSRV
jgi:hypothetical protein